MSVLEVFQMPKPVKITGRSSTITNSFVTAIIPCIKPSENDVKQALKILDLDASNLCCAYCGDKSSEWDHLRPLVRGKQPTGYISEIGNLVPTCGKCNQSKGGQDWRSWMMGRAKQSPKSRKIQGLDKRISRLEDYEKWRNVHHIDFEKIVPKDIWSRYQESKERLHALMKESQKLAIEISESIKAHMGSKKAL